MISMDILNVTLRNLQAAISRGNSTRETRIKSGHGTQHPAEAIVVTLRNNFQCGINTGLNFIHTMVRIVESQTGMEILNCFRLRFESAGKRTGKKELLKF